MCMYMYCRTSSSSGRHVSARPFISEALESSTSSAKIYQPCREKERKRILEQSGTVLYKRYRQILSLVAVYIYISLSLLSVKCLPVCVYIYIYIYIIQSRLCEMFLKIDRSNSPDSRLCCSADKV